MFSRKLIDAHSFGMIFIYVDDITALIYGYPSVDGAGWKLEKEVKDLGADIKKRRGGNILAQQCLI